MPQRLVLKSFLRNENITILLSFLFVCTCCSTENLYNNASLQWHWIERNTFENAQMNIIHQELFGEGNSIRLLQSMGMYDSKAFCFNDGTECYVFDINSKQEYNTGMLPENCHHNNAQFLDVYYESNDKYPLLLLSRGNYPPDQNEVYIVRIEERSDSIVFKRIKTIKNTLIEAKNGGSWVADVKSNRLFMYTMTTSDWRVKENNYFCIFSFDLPDVLNANDVTLGYEDVKKYWEYNYLIHQGGTYYNGYLFFNVQSMDYYQGKSISTGKDVILVNAQNGFIEAIMPLADNKETEGICIYNDKLYVSFKNGNKQQYPTSIVFSLKEYTLPESIRLK